MAKPMIWFQKEATSGVVESASLPLSWRIVPQQRDWPDRLERVLAGMVAEVTAALPPECTVTVLADRGLVGPTIIDGCQAAGWHVVLRLRGSDGDQTRVRRADGTITRVFPLLVRAGQRLAEPVAIFKDAGWRPGWLTIHWAHGEAEPWVLFSTRPGGPARVREYRKRSRVEATYQDWKGRGFDLERSRITAVARLERLLLGLVIATWWVHGLGLGVIRSGQRRHYDRPTRRTRSLIQLGRACFLARLRADRRPPLPFRAQSGGWVYRWTP